MSNQIFKQKIPNNLLFDLLEKICMKTNDHYVMNNVSFKKGIYNSEIPKFLEICSPYYHLSKRKYLEKNLNSRSFSTVVRQICNSNQIKYISKIVYDKSSYDIFYYIYF
jgi:hypothetical protein